MIGLTLLGILGLLSLFTLLALHWCIFSAGPARDVSRLVESSQEIPALRGVNKFGN